MNTPLYPSSPIGVYDSGVGGLSVLRALRLRLPGERFLYVADSGNAPYGNRAHDFLESRAMDITRFMLRHHAKALVLACNTISVVAAQKLRLTFTLPFVAMEPAIKPAVSTTRSRVVIVLATTTTVDSNSVEKLCRLYGSQVQMILQPCPGLAEQVEKGAFTGKETQQMLERFLRPGLNAGADTIVLGCTHYPFLWDQIAQIAGPQVTLIEPSEAIARQLAHVLHIPDKPLHMANEGATTFYTSGSVAAMRSFLLNIGEGDPDVKPLPEPPGNPSGPLLHWIGREKF